MVWELGSGQLWSLPRADPIAVLGKDPDQLAVLSTENDRDWEFALWSLVDKKPLFRQPIVARKGGQGFFPLPVRSMRYAFFTSTDRSVLKVWDHVRHRLDEVPLHWKRPAPRACARPVCTAAVLVHANKTVAFYEGWAEQRKAHQPFVKNGARLFGIPRWALPLGSLCYTRGICNRCAHLCAPTRSYITSCGQ
ncbi:MAG: hypothetical protein ACREWG_08800 [Gammaproteobacteria bacterium]